MARYIAGITLAIGLLLQCAIGWGATSAELQESFYQALAEGKTQEITRILARGFKVDSAYDDGQTPLMKAAQHGYADIVELLLKHKARIDARDSDGATPLMLAAKGGHTDIVRVLLNHQAKVNGANSAGWTPLMYACIHDNPEVIRLLLANGAAMEARDKRGETALLKSYHNKPVMELLISHRADAGAINNDGENLLILAVSSVGGELYGDEEHKKRFLDTIRYVITITKNLEARDNRGNSAVIAAHGSHEILELLIKAGADPNARNFRGENALMLAASGNYYNSARVLLENGANMSLADNYGHTPLWFASHCSIKCGNVEKELKAHGAKDEVAPGGGTEFPCRQVTSSLTFDLPGTKPPSQLLFLEGRQSSVQALLKSGGTCRLALPHPIHTYDLRDKLELKKTGTTPYPDIVIRDEVGNATGSGGTETTFSTYAWNGSAYEQKGLRESVELNRKALSLMANGKLNEALTLWRQAYKLVRDNNVELINNMGFAYYRKWVKEKDATSLTTAERLLRQAIGLDKKRWQAHLNLADLYSVTGKKTEALEHYEQAIALNPNKSSITKIRKKIEALQQRVDSTVVLADVREKINRNLPAYRFTIHGDPETRIATRIIITDTATNKVIQDFDVATECEDMEPRPDNDFFTLVDMNFDGYKDIGLLTSWGATGNTYTSYWLFDPRTGTFVFSKEFSGLGTETLDPKTKQITTHSNGGHAGMIFSESTYVVKDNKPVLIREVNQDYDEKKGYYIEITKEPVKGNLTVTGTKIVPR